jgi:hypothetical protein
MTLVPPRSGDFPSGFCEGAQQQSIELRTNHAAVSPGQRVIAKRYRENMVVATFEALQVRR